jgi:iron complex outermembrane receptor protein
VIDTDFGEITSISAIRNWRTDNGQDSDFTTADLAYRVKDGTNYAEFTTYSQEIRLAGQTEKFDWLVGAFLADERLDNKANFLYGNDYEQYMGRLLSRSAVNPAGVANFVALLLNRAPNTSFVGGQGLRDQLQAARHHRRRLHQQHLARDRRLRHHRRPALLDRREDAGHLSDHQRRRRGLRHRPVAGRPGAHRRHRRRGQRPDGDRQPLPALGQPAVQRSRHHQKHKDKEWSGTLKASYRFSPEVFSYASYARGYKGGGFNLDRTQSSNGLPTGGRASCRSTTPRSRPNSSTATSWA